MPQPRRAKASKPKRSADFSPHPGTRTLVRWSFFLWLNPRSIEATPQTRKARGFGVWGLGGRAYPRAGSSAVYETCAKLGSAIVPASRDEGLDYRYAGCED